MRVWRTYQKIISDSRPDFKPEGLVQWVKDNTKQYNVETFKMIHELEHRIKLDFSAKLESKYGDRWLTSGLPPKVYRQANNLMGKQNYENSANGIQNLVTIWDCVSIANLKDIAIFGPNWSELFENTFTRPEDLKISGGKSAKTEWITKLSTISSNINNSNYSVSEEEYLFIESLHRWLIPSD